MFCIFYTDKMHKDVQYRVHCSASECLLLDEHDFTYEYYTIGLTTRFNHNGCLV